MRCVPPVTKMTFPLRLGMPLSGMKGTLLLLLKKAPILAWATLLVGFGFRHAEDGVDDWETFRRSCHKQSIIHVISAFRYGSPPIRCQDVEVDVHILIYPTSNAQLLALIRICKVLDCRFSRQGQNWYLCRRLISQVFTSASPRTAIGCVFLSAILLSFTSNWLLTVMAGISEYLR